MIRNGTLVRVADPLSYYGYGTVVESQQTPTSAYLVRFNAITDRSDQRMVGRETWILMGHVYLDSPDNHDPVSTTWYTRGMWPTCRCGYDPHDSGLLNAHWAAYGFRVVDEHGHLATYPITEGTVPRPAVTGTD